MPNLNGKYFTFAEEGAENYANSKLNAGKSMTITSIKVPERFLENGYAFVDGGTGPGQVGPSIQFDERALPELYRIMSDPIMLR